MSAGSETARACAGPRSRSTKRGRRQGRARPHHHPAGCARSHRADCIAAILDHRLGRAAEPRDQLSHRVRRGARRPAPGRLLDAPAYGRCPRCERQLLGQRRLRLLFPGQLELATCQYASARRPILSTDATALVVRRGTPRVGRMVAQGDFRSISQRLYDACFHAAGRSHRSIAVVAGVAGGFRALVMTGSGMPVERLGD